MEKYFHIDHAMRSCIMASTNLVTKSQRYAKSDDFLEKLITCFHWKRMLLCLEYCDAFADVFMWIWQENGRKTLGQSTAYLATEIQHFVRTFVVWQLFLWQDRSSFCFGRWQPVAHALYQPQNAAVLKRRQPRTSDTAIRASRKFAGPYVWSLLPGACHWNSYVGFASWPFGGGNTTWIFDCLNRSCIKGLQCCLDGLLHVPARPRRSQIKKLCGEITIGTGGLPRFGAYAEGGILNIVEYKVLDFAIVGVIFWKPKFVVASWSYHRMKKVHFFRW